MSDLLNQKMCNSINKMAYLHLAIYLYTLFLF